MPRRRLCLGFYVCDLEFGICLVLCLFIYLCLEPRCRESRASFSFFSQETCAAQMQPKCLLPSMTPPTTLLPESAAATKPAPRAIHTVATQPLPPSVLCRKCSPEWWLALVALSYDGMRRATQQPAFGSQTGSFHLQRENGVSFERRRRMLIFVQGHSRFCKQHVPQYESPLCDRCDHCDRSVVLSLF